MTKRLRVFCLLISTFCICQGLSPTSTEPSNEVLDDAVTSTPPMQPTVTKAYSTWLGIMMVKQSKGNSSTQRKVCTSFYPEISDMPHYESTAVYLPVIDTFDWWPCSTSPPPGPLAGHLLLLDGRLNDTNCSLLQAAAAVQGFGAVGSIFVRDKRAPDQTATNVSLWLTFISNATYQSIISDDSTLVAVYSPPEDSALNYSLIVIWLLAVGTVFVGAFWSGRIRHSLYSGGSRGKRRHRSSDAQEEEHNSADASASADAEAEEALKSRQKDEVYVSVKVMLFLVLMMCVMLLALYYLYNYLVYVIIGLFCIASVTAVYSCLEPLVLMLPCATCRTPHFNIYVLRGQVEVRQLLLFSFSVALALAWLLLRNESYAWILQDILGVAFCINMLRLIRLPNLKICTVLLACLFFYDIFFVFITPLFTSDGNSIMVEVAKGSGEQGEQLPMVFKVPHFVYSEEVQVCGLSGNYNLLGFGDVLVPGLLIAFLYYFDLSTRPHRWPLYFTVNIIAYSVGLCLTFLALYMMRSAQPALLYLVPCTLLVTVVIAALRGDLAAMWAPAAAPDEALDKIHDEGDDAAAGDHGTRDDVP
ncbi:signal peptide peptidase-like 2B [Hyalella azteca]|uniref:Signal peptide peptidase-like 2B n=1 Tax=Hyalella azteca TaxID=294128 RepID=A0A8B7NW36_HYAAZ|nr:signal peptide peptidase-like 2B [Hyalella azteca]